MTATYECPGAVRPPPSAEGLTADAAGDQFDSRACDPSQEHARLMSEFGADFDGRHYRLLGYRYTRAEDAVAHARLLRSRPSLGPALQPSPFRRYDAVVAPTAADERQMASLGIWFDAGRYAFGTYRYDRFTDAVAYAELIFARRPAARR